MGDMGEIFRELDKYHKERKRKNIESASDEGWIKHTDHHWSRMLNGKRLDYWPSTTRFQYEGRVHVGGIEGFIKKRTVTNQEEQ